MCFSTVATLVAVVGLCNVLEYFVAKHQAWHPTLVSLLIKALHYHGLSLDLSVSGLVPFRSVLYVLRRRARLN